MDRDGFTLLVMEFNDPKAMKFKEWYIRQFNEMESQKNDKFIERQKGIVVRQALTSVIQQLDESKQMHGFAYSNYTNCIYKVLFGMNAKQLREKYGIDKNDNLRDCFNSEELKAIQSMEFLVTGLIGCGKGYDEIKEYIGYTNSKLQITG